MEDAYRKAVALVITLARALGKPSPILTRADRRATAQSELHSSGCKPLP
jgi:hypothetical protein